MRWLKLVIAPVVNVVHGGGCGFEEEIVVSDGGRVGEGWCGLYFFIFVISSFILKLMNNK